MAIGNSLSLKKKMLQRYSEKRIRSESCLQKGLFKHVKQLIDWN